MLPAAIRLIVLHEVPAITWCGDPWSWLAAILGLGATHTLWARPAMAVSQMPHKNATRSNNAICCIFVSRSDRTLVSSGATVVEERGGGEVVVSGLVRRVGQARASREKEWYSSNP